MSVPFLRPECADEFGAVLGPCYFTRLLHAKSYDYLSLFQIKATLQTLYARNSKQSWTDWELRKMRLRSRFTATSRLPQSPKMCEFVRFCSAKCLSNQDRSPGIAFGPLWSFDVVCFVVFCFVLVCFCLFCFFSCLLVLLVCLFCLFVCLFACLLCCLVGGWFALVCLFVCLFVVCWIEVHVMLQWVANASLTLLGNMKRSFQLKKLWLCNTERGVVFNCRSSYLPSLDPW